MAEIHIERKESRNWLWIILVLAVLALLAWWLLSRQNATSDPTFTDTLPGAVVDTGPVAAPGTGATADYLAFVEDNRARADMSDTHEFTADGIRRLAAALGSVVDQGAVAAGVTGAELRPRVDWLRAKADSLQQDPRSGEHAGQARDAFLGAVAIMDELRTQYPNTAAQVTQARRAAEAVNARGQLLEQRAAVQQFFERAAEVLRNTTGA